jgi:hypothetical protein
MLRKLRCCPWRAGQLAKAIHVLRLAKSQDENAHRMTHRPAAGFLPHAFERVLAAGGRPPSQPGPGPAAGAKVRVPGSGPPMSSRNGGYLSVISPA